MMRKPLILLSVLALSAVSFSASSADEISSDQTRMVLVKNITGAISPKSVLSSRNGLVSAQNMMYKHTVTIYDANTFELLQTVPDTVRLGDFGYTQYSGNYRGAPVEGAFSPDGKYLYFTNYAMYGKGFTKEGHDTCSPASGFDTSFLSRIDLSTYAIDAVYPVGAVPKVVQVTPDNKYILVTNWCSYTMTVISVSTQKVVKTIKIGAYPRGIVVKADSSIAYVAEMGGRNIHAINLKDFSQTLIPVGSNPRALVLSPDESKLYVTLNAAGKVIAWDLINKKAIKSVTTGKAARSLTISEDGTALFVVNFFSSTISKVRASDMKVIQTIKTCKEPIGITYDSPTTRTWVACYDGSIKVFDNK